MKQSTMIWLAIAAIAVYFLLFHHKTPMGQQQVQAAVSGANG